MTNPFSVDTSGHGNGAESVSLIDWNFERGSLEKASKSMGLASVADVVRASIRTVCVGVFALRDSGILDNERIGLLDEYDHEHTERAMVRFNNLDILDGTEAARICGLSFGNFAYRATCFVIEAERQKPGFMARVKAADAAADMSIRKIFSETDIQPWGDEDYRDYGISDEEDL